MCLILFGYQVSSRYDLIMAANRDEFYARPTAPMCFWEDSNEILAGKDLEQGGTWFGVTRSGRFAALTNYRDPSSVKSNTPSRGRLVTDFLTSDIPADQYSLELKKQALEYNGFNLLYGTRNDVYCYSNISFECIKVRPGIHGLSNRFLDSPWPKVQKGKKELSRIIQAGISKEKLFELLKDTTPPPDRELPHTGVGLEWERILSPLFIDSRGYGTRSSTVMTIDRAGRFEVTERTHFQDKQGGFKDRTFIVETDVKTKG